MAADRFVIGAAAVDPLVAMAASGACPAIHGIHQCYIAAQVCSLIHMLSELLVDGIDNAGDAARFIRTQFARVKCQHQLH
jgi:hypothetical protein